MRAEQRLRLLARIFFREMKKSGKICTFWAKQSEPFAPLREIKLKRLGAELSFRVAELSDFHRIIILLDFDFEGSSVVSGSLIGAHTEGTRSF